MSFSNIIDENSNELYKGLSDKNFVVKKNTLMVLTHLILNGMIKVKGQLGEMAKCLEDPEPRISDLAKLFFNELSTKDNAIYNNLPDGSLSVILFSLQKLMCHSCSYQSSFHRRTCCRGRGIPKHVTLHLHFHRKGRFTQLGNRFFFIDINDFLFFLFFLRKNKQKPSSTNYANVLGSPKTLDNGEILHTVFPFSPSNPIVQSRNLLKVFNSIATSFMNPLYSSDSQRFLPRSNILFFLYAAEF